MHTKFCEHDDGQDDFSGEKWREWWPTGSPVDVDVSALSATVNNLTNPTKLPLSNGKWLAFWGNYAGLRIGFNPVESFQAMSPCVVPYPDGADIYLSKDTGGAGIVSLGRFQSRAAALAFCGSRPSSTAKVPPGGSAYTPGDAQANPTDLLGTEAFQMLWDFNNALWKRAGGSAGDTDGILATAMAGLSRSFNYGYDNATAAWDRQRGYGNSADALTPVALNGGAGIFPGVSSFGFVMNDRTTNIDRMRQPDSRQALGAVGSAVSLATTGVKLTYTVQANKNALIRVASIRHVGGGATGAVQLEVVRSAVTYVISTALVPAAGTQVGLLPGSAGGGGVGTAGDLPLLAGDVIQVNCTTALAGETADIILAGVTDRFTF